MPVDRLQPHFTVKAEYVQKSAFDLYSRMDIDINNGVTATGLNDNVCGCAIWYSHRLGVHSKSS